MTPNSVLADLDKAFVQFGKYSFWDKGCDSIIDPPIDEIVALPYEDFLTFMNELRSLCKDNPECLRYVEFLDDS
jgi:hypothetical protein